MLIFLDFDGVLRRKRSPLYRLDADCVNHFERAVRSLLDVEIVITSSRREAFSLDQMRRLFSPDIAARIVSVTPIDSRREGHYRYRQFCNVLLIDGERGFDSETAQKLVRVMQHPH